MVKFSNLIGNLFNKTASLKLETDAVPLPPRAKQETQEEMTTAQSNTATLQSANFLNNNQSGIPNALSGSEHLALVPNPSTQPAPTMTVGNINPSHTIVNNVQHNTLAVPQTSISNTTGMQVYQIKNANNLHIGNSYTYNAAAVEDAPSSSGSLPGPSSVKWANLRLSNTISQIMQCEDDVDTEIIDTISRHLGFEWKSFARKLEYSEGQIDAFEADNNTLSERIYDFVLDWTRNEDEPTLGRLVTLLWNNKHKETVYYIKQLWKKRREQSSPGRSS
ncbi:protein immune deficiency [Anopheles nili]|uniref:protein immune deficiency n=1 Tax=Anopheles nili TaxID=185578 RepID=UPI00237A901B|nr:protein immune deficiency [Anopheles nili]